MPLNKRSFFLAATAIELALLLGDGRSQYTGNCTNDINTTAVSALSSVRRDTARNPVEVNLVALHKIFEKLAYHV